MFNRLLPILLVLGLTGCYTIPEYADDDALGRHHIGSDIYGAYEPYYASTKELHYNAPWSTLSPEQIAENAALYAAYQKHLDAIEGELLGEIQKSMSSRKPIRILLFMHGGLNHPSGSTERLERHLEDATRDGFYPLFVSWRSGAFRAMADRYWHVRQGRTIEGPLAYPRGATYFVSDVLSGVANFPETLWNGTANAMKQCDRPKKGTTDNVVQWSCDWLNRDRDDYQAKYPEHLLWVEGQNFSIPMRGWIQARKVVPGVARIVTTPLTQGFGTQAWNMMLRRAENLMEMEADVLDINEGYCSQCGNRHGHGVLSLLADRLGKIAARARTQSVPMEIMLVGHSMGGILANRMVADYPELPYKTIIHMASADSLSSFLEKTAPWLRDHPDAEFFNVVLHPSHEDNEATAQSLIPPGSLLVWLDDMFAAPHHVLDRRSGRWDNARYLLHTFRDDLKNARLKVFPLNGDGLPRKHGDFGACQFWKRDFYWQDAVDKPTKKCHAKFDGNGGSAVASRR